MLSDIDVIATLLNRLQAKVEQNIMVEGTIIDGETSADDGLLTHSLNEYLDCLQVDVEGFKDLLNEDVDTWEKGLE